MTRIHFILFLGTLFFAATSIAQDVLEYTASKSSNGTSVMDYTSSDGSRLRQVRRPDGTITTTQIDSVGKKTITKQHPDGKLEVRTENPAMAANDNSQS